MSGDDDKVGYKRPPRNTQFKPGQSGNPSGKNKGSRNIATELAEILSEHVTFTEGGAIKTMTKQRALAAALVSAAIEGDLRATAIVLSHLSRDSHLSAAEGNDVNDDGFLAVRAHRKKKRR